jgi:flagellar hook-length control protein FliK
MSTTAPQPLLTTPGEREPIPSPTGGAPPGSPPEGPPFQSALETEWARTAIAEGHQQSHSQASPPAQGEAGASTADSPNHSPRGCAQPTRHGGHHATSMPSGSTAATSVALPTSTPRAPGSLARPEPTSTSTGDSTEALPTALPGRTAPVASDDALPARTSAVEGAQASVQDGGATTGALALPRPGATTAGTSAQTHPTPAAAPSGDPAAPHSPSAPSADTSASTLATTLDSSTSSTGDTSVGGDGSPTHTDTNRAAGQVRLRGASDAGAHEKLWVADSAQASSAGAAGESGGVGGLDPTASPQVSAALDGNPQVALADLGPAAYGVGLQEAIESLHGTIQLAARQGLSQARISLQPEELGAIRINLTQTAQGLLARVTAESPAAAQALAAAHAELRQSLSSLGINLTRLDVGHHESSTQSGGTGPKGDGQGGTAHGESSAGGRPSRSGRSPVIAALTNVELASPPAAGSAPSTTTLSHGTLIDVLA